MQVAVIGAGIIGVTLAHALLDEGHTVTLIDTSDQPGRACDGNAGWIAHTDILPLASPKSWRHVARWLADPLGPLAVRPHYVPQIAPWLVRFLWASRPAAVARSTAAIRAINAEALAAWRLRLDSLHLSQHLRERGQLAVWSSPLAFEAARAVIARQRAFGIPVEVLETRDAVRALEPVLSSAAVAGALYPTGCHVGDPATFVGDLARIARERGVEAVRERARTVIPSPAGADVILESGTRQVADAVVVAAGAWSRPLAASLGDPVPLDTERGYNITVRNGALGLSRPVAFEGEGFVTTPLDGGDRVGGAVEFAGLHTPPNHARTDAIWGRLRRFLPDLPANPDGRRWMGFRPSLPDSLPVIGPARASSRVIYAFGHAHHGLTQAAVTGGIVADLVASRAPRLDITPFTAQRFARRGRDHGRPSPTPRAP